MHEPPVRFGSMFSGVGPLDLGLCLAGIEHAWFCERDEFRRGILRQRWPGRPVLGDVRDVGAATVERVDGIAGGFPCKGASSAGKRDGFDNAETVLWREMARAVRELRPRYVVVENVADILGLHDGEVWAEVVGTLAALGYDTTWDCIPAAAVGAPHLRDRVFAVAVADDDGSRADADAAAGGSWPAARERGDGVATYAAGELERAAVDEAHAKSGGGHTRALPRDGGAVVAADSAPAGRGASEHAAAAVLRGEGGQSDAAGRGCAVEWGDYEPAIRRWENVVGRAAPEPLVRGVDDRGARRVDRSRLSALGDGVQVQVGQIVGEYVMRLERERLTSAAAR